MLLLVTLFGESDAQRCLSQARNNQRHERPATKMTTGLREGRARRGKSGLPRGLPAAETTVTTSAVRTMTGLQEGRGRTGLP